LLLKLKNFSKKSNYLNYNLLQLFNYDLSIYIHFHFLIQFSLYSLMKIFQFCQIIEILIYQYYLKNISKTPQDFFKNNIKIIILFIYLFKKKKNFLPNWNRINKSKILIFLSQNIILGNASLIRQILYNLSRLNILFLFDF